MEILNDSKVFILFKEKPYQDFDFITIDLQSKTGDSVNEQTDYKIAKNLTLKN